MTDPSGIPSAIPGRGRGRGMPNMVMHQQQLQQLHQQQQLQQQQLPPPQQQPQPTQELLMHRQQEYQQQQSQMNDYNPPVMSYSGALRRPMQETQQKLMGNNPSNTRQMMGPGGDQPPVYHQSQLAFSQPIQQSTSLANQFQGGGRPILGGQGPPPQHFQQQQQMFNPNGGMGDNSMNAYNQMGIGDNSRNAYNQMKTTLNVNAPTFAPAPLNAGAAEFVPRQFPVNDYHPNELRADAAEFVPRFQQPNSQMSYQTQQNVFQYNQYSQYNGSPTIHRLLNNVPQHLVAPSDGPNSLALDKVKTAIFVLTINPGNLKEYAQTLAEDLNSFDVNESTLSEITELIYEQAVTEPNFTNSGARLCDHLINHLRPKNLSENCFRNKIIMRLYEDFQKLDEMANNNDSRLHGLVMYVSELFVKMKIGGSVQLNILGDAVKKAVHTLLKYNSDKNIKCATNALKCTGAALDQMDKSQEKEPKFDDIMNLVAQLAAEAEPNTTVKLLLEKVVNLRKENWGMSESPAQSPAGTPVNNIAAPEFTQMDPVFYGPDGKPISREQAGYAEDTLSSIDLQDLNDDDEYINGTNGYDPEYSEFIDEDEMDEEIQSAYDEFLRENAAKGL